MKKTTRLTALLLALVLLLGTLSASATETTGGIPIDAFNIENYSTIKTIAEENAAAANSGENTVSGAELDAMVEACGDHVLCEHVTAMLELATAQERYDYLISLYVETVPDEVADNALYYDVFDLNYYMLEYVMMHYYECHLTEEEQQASMEGDFSSFAVCACSFPFLEPEYQPGELNVHEDGCPWEFENLSVTEQYQKIRLLSMDARAPYMATLTAEQATELETYTARQEGTLSYPCEEKPEYCMFSEYSVLTASELYDYFNDIYADENGEISELYAALMLHYGEYHLDSNLICTCGEHPLLLPDYEVGDISKHEETCPWHFANLTVSEQAIVIGSLSDKNKKSYLMTLTGAQRAALYSELDMGSDSTVDNTTELAASEETGTAAQITVPANTFGEGVDYVMSAYETTLNEAEQAAVSKAGSGNVLATFDISFDNLATGEEIQPQNGSTVELTFTIETSKVTGSHIQVYHMDETINEDGSITYTVEPVGQPVEVNRALETQTITVEADKFSKYLAESGFPDVGGCENFDCDYYFSLTTPIAQYNYLMGELWDDEGADMEAFLLHLGGYHEGALEAICTCYVPLYAPGSPEHEEGCPWHGKTATLADYYGAYKNLGTAGKEQYLKGLDDVTLEKMGRINLTSYTAAAADSNEVAISVPTGAFSEDYLLNAVSTALSEEMQTALNNKAAEVGEESMDVVSAFDISFGNLATEEGMNPAADAPVTLTFEIPTSSLNLVTNEDGTTQEMYLTVFHMLEDGETIVPEVVGKSVAVDPTAEYQAVTIDADAFSIYAVIGTYADDWNYNNYQITMTVGDSQQIYTSTGGDWATYSWSIVRGNADAFALTNANNRTATIKATAPGKITLQCRISGYYSTIEEMVVEALPSVGDSVDDDIIFYNIDKDYTAGDTEYENTYGPYVMKIRFEDTNGDVLKYDDGTTVGDDYYVFDSEASIDKYTFSADAPDGYTYSGAFFYWSGHFSGDKVYVTSVDRVDSIATGSYLWYSGNHTTLGEKRWAYQASGVLHVVYAPIDEVYTVVFKDHCGYDLANYALSHNDSGVKFPSGYVPSIDTMANETIPAHHAAYGEEGQQFLNSWVVTGGGDGIDGTYTTSELKSKITKWTIKSNITITAQCDEPKVTINYMVIPSDGSYGLVDLNDSTNAPQVAASETVLVVNGNVVGATAIPEDGYELEGWYVDAAGTIPVNSDWLNSDGTVVIPQRMDNDDNPDTVGAYEAATYYAKFVEKAVTINYVVVAPIEGGDVDLNDGTTNLVDSTSETLQVFSGNAVGATAVAAANYKFVGWYDENGTKLSDQLSYVPAKGTDGKNVAATYYAKFEWNLGSLTITKTGMDAGDSAIFDVYINNTPYTTVVLTGASDSVTLSGLPANAGYKVEEDGDWSWRYTATAQTGASGTIPGGGTATASFVNTKSNDHWLSDESIVKNVLKAPANSN